MKHFTDDELIDYLHGELSEAADARVHQHLSRCGDCQARCDAEAALGDMLRNSALAEQHEFPAMIRAGVWAAIRTAEPTVLERIRRFITPLIAVPIAAAAALLLYLGVPIVRGDRATGAPTVSALYYLEEHAAQAQENPLADHPSTNAALAAQVPASAPLIDAADAATLDDIVSARE